MNIGSLMSALWDMRKSGSSSFSVAKTLFNGTKLLGRDSSITINGKPGTIFYRDQNPFGKSVEASRVRRGELKTDDIGWLWVVTKERPWQRTWLAKVVRGEVETLRDGDYDQKTNSLKLK